MALLFGKGAVFYLSGSKCYATSVPVAILWVGVRVLQSVVLKTCQAHGSDRLSDRKWVKSTSEVLLAQCFVDVTWCVRLTLEALSRKLVWLRGRQMFFVISDVLTASLHEELEPQFLLGR